MSRPYSSAVRIYAAHYWLIYDKFNHIYRFIRKKLFVPEQYGGNLRVSVVRIKKPHSNMTVQLIEVGAGGFEPPSSRTRTVRSNRAEPRPDCG
jgi:hypothetical protein